MKLITHPLAISALEHLASSRGTATSTLNAWYAAGFPLYTDPTPLPAPALGMRVWFTTRVETSSYTDSFDVRSGPPKEWGDALKGVEFTHIVDFRTDEVIWRRQ
jgi:hypothetical protein